MWTLGSVHCATSEPSCCAKAMLSGVASSAVSTESAGMTIWIISQSPSCLSFQSLKTHQNQYCSTTLPGWSGSVVTRP